MNTAIRNKLGPMLSNLRQQDEHHNGTDFPTSSGSILLDGNCTSCIHESLCGTMSMPISGTSNMPKPKVKRKQGIIPNRSPKVHNDSSSSSIAQSSFDFPNTLPSIESSSTCDTHMITSRIPFFWRSHPNIHVRKQQLLDHNKNTKTLFEDDRIKAFDGTKIVYSPTEVVSLYSKPSDEEIEQNSTKNKHSIQKGSVNLKQSLQSQRGKPNNARDVITEESNHDDDNDSETAPHCFSEESNDCTMLTEDDTKRRNNDKLTFMSSSVSSSLSMQDQKLISSSSSTVLLSSSSILKQDRNKKQAVSLKSSKTNSFAEELLPQLHLFPECQQMRNKSTDSFAPLELSPIPPPSSSGWVSFPDFPES